MLSPRNVEKLLTRFHFLFHSGLARDLRSGEPDVSSRSADRVVESVVLLLGNLFLARVLRRGPADDWVVKFVDNRLAEPDLKAWVELQHGLVGERRVGFEEVFGLDTRRRDVLEALSKRYLDHLETVASCCRGEVDADRSAYDAFVEFLLNYFKAELVEDRDGSLRLVGRGGSGFKLDPLVRPVRDEVEVYLGLTTSGLRFRNLARGESRLVEEPMLLRRFAEVCLLVGGYRQAAYVAHEVLGDDALGRCARHASLGALAYRKGEYHEAIAEFERASTLKPEATVLGYHLSLAHTRLSDYGRATQLLVKLVERDPSFDRGYELLADLAQLKGDAGQARRLYERALAANPNNRTAEKKRARYAEERRPNAASRSDGKRGQQEAQGNDKGAHDLLVDLSQQARETGFHPVVGRDTELAQMIEILSCEMRSNPLLIGEPGVGKTALVEELARRIVNGDVPRRLRGRKLYMMSVASLLAGAKFRGQFEERVLQLIQTLKSESCILFIDDIHTIVNSGLSKGGTLDTSSLLKPALVRGEIQAIGATTFDEYRMNIEKDPSLVRSFQSVVVDEPKPEAAPEMLAPHVERLADHHSVVYGDIGLVDLANLVKVCLRERRLPDVAINVLDRAAARVAIERVATAPDEPPLVTRDDIGVVLSEMSGVPVARLTDTQVGRLLSMEKLLADRVVGQDEAVGAVAQVIRTAKMDLNLNASRPDGVFLFVGPSGVGKTELARTLAEFLFGDENKVIRIDMSEYMEKISSSRLIGTAPGYVGYNDQNQLTDQVRKSPYSVVLLDEIEKADAQMLNLFLQVFDAGRLTDGKGRTVHFNNTTFIMTSNVGTHLFSKNRVGYGDGPVGSGVSHSELMKEVKRFFPPEFLNRVDEVVLFRQLDEDDLVSITRVQLRDLTRRLTRQGIDLVVTDEVCRKLARDGYSSEFGARKLGRAIRRQILDPLATAALGTRWEQVVRVEVGLGDGEVDVSLTYASGGMEPVELTEAAAADSADLVQAAE